MNSLSSNDMIFLLYHITLNSFALISLFYQQLPSAGTQTLPQIPHFPKSNAGCSKNSPNLDRQISFLPFSAEPRLLPRGISESKEPKALVPRPPPSYLHQIKASKYLLLLRGIIPCPFIPRHPPSNTSSIMLRRSRSNKPTSPPRRHRQNQSPRLGHKFRPRLCKDRKRSLSRETV